MFSLFFITASQMACLPHRNSLVSIVFSTILSVVAWLLPRIAPASFYVVFVAAAAAEFVFDFPPSPEPLVVLSALTHGLGISGFGKRQKTRNSAATLELQ